MKIACCLVVLGLAVVSADLLSLLKRVHNSDTFVHMPHYEQLLLVELMAEAEMGQLTQYIHTVGMSRISTMMQHLPQHEADLLTQYLKELYHDLKHTVGGKPVVMQFVDDYDCGEANSTGMVLTDH